jgi:hypothetical protein
VKRLKLTHEANVSNADITEAENLQVKLAVAEIMPDAAISN